MGHTGLPRRTDLGRSLPRLYGSWSEFSTLPRSLRDRLASEFEIAVLEPVTHVRSKDGQTRKTAFRCTTACRSRRVLMCYAAADHPLHFVAGGLRDGLRVLRHRPDGLPAQSLQRRDRGPSAVLCPGAQSQDRSLTNIVVMGMGEPFHNYDNTMGAIDRLNDATGFGFGARRFTISTVGLPSMIRRFADEKRQVNLAISLHAADDALRTSMLPVNRKFAIDEVLDACRYYAAQTGRRLTFEWALIQGVNDTPEQARALGARLRGLLCHVNAIPLNPTTGYAGKATSRDTALLFKAELERMGIACTVRLRRGIDIAAGCGQLGG